VKKFRWEVPARPIPKHPYRDSAVLYAVLAGVVVGVTALTKGDVGRSAIIACALFVVATAYSWWRWRERIRQRAEDR
jgi:membrane protein implicated in regulation of membrane protease activity